MLIIMTTMNLMCFGIVCANIKSNVSVRKHLLRENSCTVFEMLLARQRFARTKVESRIQMELKWQVSL